MFNNNRQTRRRFRLGNLARLLQLRQSVSRQPQQPLPLLSPETLQEMLLKSPPQSPSVLPSPNQVSSPIHPPQSLELPQQVQPQLIQRQEQKSVEAKTPPSSPSTLKATIEHQSQPSPPSLSESAESQPSKLSPQTKTSPLSLNANEESQSQPLPPFKPIDEPPSFLNSAESQPPDLPPPPPPSKSTNETLFRSPPISSKASKNLQSQPAIRFIPPPSQPLKSSQSRETIEKVNKNRASAIWSEKQKPESTMMMKMFVNSNVQGFITSLSIHSSSIDHDPGVHLTIDHDQNL